MIVVADTSPICYLLLIDEIDLLPALFTTILIPGAVARELRHPAVPPAVKLWMAAPPPWLEIRESAGRELSPRLNVLDEGEREAILLTQRLGADLLIVDDKAAREAAESLGLKITGILGVLTAGSRRGWVDLAAAVARLQRTNFRAAPALLRRLLESNP